MSRRRENALSRRSLELAVAVPQVVAHRLTRLALADANPSARDRREFHKMGAEKMLAFQQSWLAMSVESMRATQQLSMTMMQMAWTPWWSSSAGMRSATTRGGAAWQRAWLDVATAGQAPVHRAATANARRLARTKLR